MSYEIQSGETSSGIILEYDSMFVFEGGTATVTTINSGGNMNVFGGPANSTTVNSGGTMLVFSGGTANSTTVNSGGGMDVYSGGTATNIVAAEGARLFLTVASDTYLQGTYAGSAFEMKNASISGWEVNSGIEMSVCSGGTANKTTINDGLFCVYAGGTANSTTVNSGGYMIIYGTADNITVISGGYMNIYSGGTANSTTVNSGGSMLVSSGGTATNIVATDGAILSIDVAPNTYIQGTYAGSAFEMKNASISGCEVNSGIGMTVCSGGTANSTTVNSGGSMDVTFGGTAKSTTVNSGGSMDVTFSGTANETTINNSGLLCVYGGGTANSITVNSSGCMYVDSGGTATEIKENGGYVFVVDGADVSFVAHTISGITISNSASIHSGTTAYGVTINSVGSIHVCSGGTANSTTISSGGMIEVFSGGTANSTTVNSGGSMYVVSGGTATTVMENGGFVEFEDGADVTFAANTFSGITITNSASIHSGTIANSVTIDGAFPHYGTLYVFSGGTANNTTINWGGLDYGTRLFVYGLANDTTVSGGALFSLEKGGVASNTTVEVHMGVYAGSFGISSDAVAYNTTIYGGRMYVSSGGSASNTLIRSEVGYVYGLLQIASGGVATDNMVTSFGTIHVLGTAINNTLSAYWLPTSSACMMIVSSGGVASNNMIHTLGYILVSSGGTANGTTVNSGGTLHISSGGKLTGQMTISGGAVVSAFEGSIIDFDIASVAPGATAPLNNLSLVSGWSDANFTLTVSGSQTAGTYTLAGSASGFNKTITIQNISGETLGTLTVGNSTKIGNNDCTLNLSNQGTLYLTISTVYSDLVIENETVVAHDKEIFLDATINSNGKLYVESGGTANSATVDCGGMLHISSGGTANSTTLNSGGRIIVSFGGTVNDTVVNHLNIYSDGLAVSSGGIANHTTITSGGEATVLEDGVANFVTVMEDAEFHVFGSANNVIAQSDGFFCVYAHATATDITIEDGGHFHFEFSPDNYIQWTSGGSSYEIKDGIVSGFTFENGGGVVAQAGAITTDIILNDEGSIDVAKNGLASNTVVNAYGHLSTRAGGVLKDMTVNSRGYLRVSSGGTMTGQINIASGAVLSVSKGAVLNFDITELKPGTAARVNNLSLLQSKQQIIYTLTVSDRQTSGLYSLADSVNEQMIGSISVQNVFGQSLGTLSVGSTLSASEYDYTLNMKNGSLCLDVVGPDLDLIAPTVTIIQANINSPTNQSIVLTADYADNVELSQSLYKIGEKGEWAAYADGVTVTENTTVYFKAIDAAGNESEIVSYTVSNIDKVAPGDPSGLLAVVSGKTTAMLWSVSTDDSSGVREYVVTYSVNGQVFTARTSGTNYVLNDAELGDYSWSVQAVDFAGNESAVTEGEAFTVSGFKPYTVEYSADSFEHTIRFAVSSPALDVFRMPGGSYRLRVRQEGGGEWTEGDSIVAAEFDEAPQLVRSDADGNSDVFFANAVGTWESGYLAQHTGSVKDWGGTGEYVSLFGRNRLADIIEGSDDANILLMTDNANGDALFVDDIYTALPGSITEQQARIAQIDEIRAGAGNDIVDMTSQRFEYIGGGLTIRGGAGDDTIWANKGDNWLFGDAGNDRIVSASGNDVIVGGIGNDRMHGGGGSDVFTFCENWGTDTVEQLETGSVTLWFAESESQITASELDGNSVFTNTAGTASVTVRGFALANIEVKYGDDGSEQFAELSGAGAFFDATTERIFEESGKGILASL